MNSKIGYDEIIVSNDIQYGIINGIKKHVFYIKVGNGGSITGYENKYLKIAISANKKYGFSVIVASTPTDINDYFNISNDINVINKCFNDPKVYAMGHSRGGAIINNYSYKFPNIERILIVNAPLMINFHKIKNGLLNFSGKSLVYIYGTEDPSFIYVELLIKHKTNGVRIVKLNNINHDFTDNLETFCELPERYLFEL